MRHINNEIGGGIITAVANHYSVEKALKSADVFIGAVFQISQKTPILISRDQIKMMHKRSLIIDASIDHGGCVETSRPTTHSDPIYLEEDIIHYCVPNITAAVPRTSSRALNNIVLPYILEITRDGLKATCENNSVLISGMYIHKGKCVDKGIGKLFNLKCYEHKC